MSGTDLPTQEINDEDVELVAKVLWEETLRDVSPTEPRINRPTPECYSDAKAVLEALVASGWRPPQEINDDAVELLARQAWRRRHSITWESALDIERQGFLTAARFDLAALVASGRVFQDVRSAQAAAVRGAGAGIRQAMGRTGVLLDGVQIAQMLDGIARQIDGGDREAGLEQAQPLLAAGSEVESLEPVEYSEGQERSDEDGRFRSCVEGILAEGCSSCGTCIDHDGCADPEHQPAEGDCEPCGACAQCIADCARARGVESSDGR